jgi:hypothetical protein
MDKSFLDGVSSAQLQFYTRNGWTFAIPEVLMYEHFRKRDGWRIANIFKLHRVEKSLFLLPGIGEMFRIEAKKLKPAITTLRAENIQFIAQKGPSGEFFELDGESLTQTEERSEQLAAKVPTMIHVWQSLREMPAIKNASPKELPEVIKEHKIKIRDDRDDMRGFYANHRHHHFPPANLIDEQWAYFRWIQVYLVAGLDFINRYGVDVVPSEENMIHELIDLDYLIPAILVGGLACREKRFLERFRLLRSNGVVLK